jgi:hypothetical protein
MVARPGIASSQSRATFPPAFQGSDKLRAKSGHSEGLLWAQEGFCEMEASEVPLDPDFTEIVWQPGGPSKGVPRSQNVSKLPPVFPWLDAAHLLLLVVSMFCLEHIVLQISGAD